MTELSYELLIPLTITCSILTLIAITTSLWAIIEVKSLLRSTHKIQYVPVPAPQHVVGDPLNSEPTLSDEELEKEFRKYEKMGELHDI